METILDFTVDIAKKAGEMQLSAFRSKDFTISYKSRTDLVTNVDKQCEEFLFNQVRSRYPDHAIIAEEGNNYKSDGPFLWYIDPLDGTNNFAHGIQFFCVSIGIYSRELQRVEYGVVYCPFFQELFTARYKHGALLNGESIKCSEIRDLGISIIATGFPYNKDDMEKNNLSEFNVMLPRVQGIRRTGSAAIDLCYVACGRCDGYWESQVKPWDIAGGSLIVEEAGGLVTDYKGRPFDPADNEIIASNGQIHDSIITTLADKKPFSY